MILIKFLKNFNIKLPLDDINEIFKNYEIDKIHKIQGLSIISE